MVYTMGTAERFRLVPGATAESVLRSTLCAGNTCYCRTQNSNYYILVCEAGLLRLYELMK